MMGPDTIHVDADCNEYRIDGVYGRTRDTTNQVTYKLGEAEDGTWVHWAGDTVLHTLDTPYEIHGLTLSRAEIASNIERELDDIDTTELDDDAERDYEYLVDHPRRVAGSLAEAWEERARGEIIRVIEDADGRAPGGGVGVARNVLFLDVAEPWRHEVDHAMDMNALETRVAREIMRASLRDAVSCERKWYYPHAEYMVGFGLDE